MSINLSVDDTVPCKLDQRLRYAAGRHSKVKKTRAISDI